MRSSTNHRKVTVAMPAFNAAAYLEEAIESVLAQDHPSFELIVCDDGSRDATGRILRRYLRHPQVRLFRHSKNRGAGTTRNDLVRQARGVYLTPCDADDLLLPGALSRFSGYLDRHPQIAAVYGDVLQLMTDARRRVVKPPTIIGMDHRHHWDLIENTINHAGSMIRTKAIIAAGGYDESVYSVDDWSLWLKLAESSKLAYLRGEIYYLWRRHPTSLTQTDRKNWNRDIAKIRAEAIARRYRQGAFARETPRTR